jgi:hypothetical protein
LRPDAIILLLSGATGVINRSVMKHTAKKTSKQPTPGAANATRKQALDAIAHNLLDIESLTPQGRDRLDFHEIHVSLLRRVMEEAWKAGARYHLGRARRAK